MNSINEIRKSHIDKEERRKMREEKNQKEEESFFIFFGCSSCLSFSVAVYINKSADFIK